MELPTQEVDKLYDYDSIYEFLTIFAMVSSTLRDREDFARAAYESLEDGAVQQMPIPQPRHLPRANQATQSPLSGEQFGVRRKPVRRPRKELLHERRRFT